MKQYFLLVLIIFFQVHKTSGQKVESIEGKIINENTGIPLSGATVRSLFTNQITNSNKEGDFKIKIKNVDSLNVSYVGYKSITIAVKINPKNLIIKLEPTDKSLQEVTINTGYQKLKPNEVNGSFVLINNEKLNQQTGLSILDRLNGVTSSLLVNNGKTNPNPENNTNISIRGLSTINGPLDPLIVVDNFIYSGDINNINPNDVESVTILKDAAAASIWGARAGNGVIVITTKKGHFKENLNIDLNSNIIITSKPDLYAFPQISSSNYIDYEEYLFNHGYYSTDFTNRSHPAISPAVQIFQNRKNGLITAQDSSKQINALKAFDNRRQFLNYYLHNGIIQQYALNIRGGGKNIGWLVSGTYDDNKDNYSGDYHKINLRFENSYKPIKNMTLSAGVYYTNSTFSSGQLDYENISTINYRRFIPYKVLAGENGRSIPILWTLDPNYIDTAGQGKLLDWKYYPLEDYKHNYSKKSLEEIMAHVSLKYNISQNLNLSLLYQYSKQNIEQLLMHDSSSYYTRDLINKYSQIDYNNGTIKHIIPLGGIRSNSITTNYSSNLRSQLNFNKNINDHLINAILGFEIRDEWAKQDGSLYYGYNPDPLTYTNNLDYSITYPTFINGAKLRIPSGGGLAETSTRYLSIYSNASYSFKGRYSFNASIRKDGSNIFGAKTNDKWNPLWSFGLGWQISKEAFYNIEWLPYFKLSATYGVSGNVDPTKSPLPLGRYGTIAIGSERLPSLSIQTLNNSQLSWEKSYQNNYRLDFVTKNSIIKASIEYYTKKGTDLYAPTPFDYTTNVGTKTITANVANMKGQGIDIEINTNNINRKFKWTTNFLYNYNQSKTTKYLTERASTINTIVGGNNAINPVVGKPLYAIAAYKWGGLDANGDPQGYINDTLTTDYRAIMQNSINKGISGGSVVYIGSATPTSYGSILNEFAYKGLYLSFNIVYKLGYYFMKPSINYSVLASSGQAGTDYDKKWTRPGDESVTNVPSLAYPLNSNRDYFYKSANINVVKADHIRLQFINLSYSIPSNLTNNIFKTLQVYVNAANLGIIWRANKNHLDPDNNYTIPSPKRYTIGIKANL